MKNIKRKESLIVIHNLKEFERKIQVENYINETLLKSSTFKLGENIEINKEDKEKNGVIIMNQILSQRYFI